MPPELGMGGEVEDLELVLVQLVDHEPDDPLAVLGDHADAVPLAEDAEKLLLAPGILEAGVLDGQNFGHVATDHPANMDADLSLGRRDRAHRASFHGTTLGRTETIPSTRGGRRKIPDQEQTRDGSDGVVVSSRGGTSRWLRTGRKGARASAGFSRRDPILPAVLAG